MFDVPLSEDLEQLLGRASAIQQLDSIGTKLETIFLLLDEIPVPQSPTTMLRILLNVPEQLTSTPINDLSHVADVSFFSNFGHHANKSADFSFNITSNIAELRAAGRFQKTS